jgi:hypothetical protein
MPVVPMAPPAFLSLRPEEKSQKNRSQKNSQKNRD